MAAFWVPGGPPPATVSSSPAAGRGEALNLGQRPVRGRTRRQGVLACLRPGSLRSSPQTIPATVREAPYFILDGLLMNGTGRRVREQVRRHRWLHRPRDGCSAEADIAAHPPSRAALPPNHWSLGEKSGEGPTPVPAPRREAPSRAPPGSGSPPPPATRPSSEASPAPPRRTPRPAPTAARAGARAGRASRPTAGPGRSRRTPPNPRRSARRRSASGAP